MNKFVKGSIAAAAATVLLLGGAGSLAYWNAEAGVGPATINAGTLTLDVDDIAWEQDITAWVPGDSDRLETTLTVVAEGDHIEGEISLDEASLVFVGQGNADISDQFVVEFAQDGAATKPATATLSYAGGVFTFAGAGTYEIPVSVDVEFLYGTAADNDAQGATVDLSELNFVVTQTDPSL